MSKAQKVWMWVFAGMFLIPELFWSTVGNFVYIFFQNSNKPSPFRHNFLIDNNAGFVYKLLVTIQFLGLVGFVVSVVKRKEAFKNNFVYYLLLLFTCIAILITLFVLYLINIVNINIL